MKTMICMAALLLLTTQSGAETYSWVDESGTYNFSDDLSRVPEKYRKKVGRRGDDGAAKPPVGEPVPARNEASASKPATAAEADKPLYDSKTQEEWRKEFDVREAELKRLELRMEKIQATLKSPSNSERSSLSALIAEHEALGKEYREKYKLYSDLVESARKAGLTVVMKK